MWAYNANQNVYNVSSVSYGIPSRGLCKVIFKKFEIFNMGNISFKTIWIEVGRWSIKITNQGQIKVFNASFINIFQTLLLILSFSSFSRDSILIYYDSFKLRYAFSENSIFHEQIDQPLSRSTRLQEICYPSNISNSWIS